MRACVHIRPPPAHAARSISLNRFALATSRFVMRVATLTRSRLGGALPPALLLPLLRCVGALGGDEFAQWAVAEVVRAEWDTAEGAVAGGGDAAARGGGESEAAAAAQSLDAAEPLSPLIAAALRAASAPPSRCRPAVVAGALRQTLRQLGAPPPPVDLIARAPALCARELGLEALLSVDVAMGRADLLVADAAGREALLDAAARQRLVDAAAASRRPRLLAAAVGAVGANVRLSAEALGLLMEHRIEVGARAAANAAAAMSTPPTDPAGGRAHALPGGARGPRRGAQRANVPRALRHAAARRLGGRGV